MKEFIKLCADRITTCRANFNLLTKLKPADQKTFWSEDQRIICRSKNLQMGKVFNLKIDGLSADRTTICRSKNCRQIIKKLSADWRIILRLKNYLEMEKSRDGKSIESEDWRSNCRLKNCLQAIQRATYRLNFDLQIIIQSQTADNSLIYK